MACNYLKLKLGICLSNNYADIKFSNIRRTMARNKGAAATCITYLLVRAFLLNRICVEIFVKFWELEQFVYMYR